MKTIAFEIDVYEATGKETNKLNNKLYRWIKRMHEDNPVEIKIDGKVVATMASIERETGLDFAKLKISPEIAKMVGLVPGHNYYSVYTTIEFFVFDKYKVEWDEDTGKNVGSRKSKKTYDAIFNFIYDELNKCVEWELSDDWSFRDTEE